MNIIKVGVIAFEFFLFMIWFIGYIKTLTLPFTKKTIKSIKYLSRLAFVYVLQTFATPIGFYIANIELPSVYGLFCILIIPVVCLTLIEIFRRK